MDAFQSPQPFQRYLFTGERILWSGQPKQGIVLGPRDALLIPFSLLWGGFAIIWNAGVWLAPASVRGGNPDWLFKLWGLPFLAIGAYVIAGRFFHDAYLRKTTRYAVTDQRVLVLRGSKLSSLDRQRLPRLELSEARDGTGTLAFDGARTGLFDSGMNGFSGWLPALGATQFYRIEHPRQVYELIRAPGR